MCLVLGIYLLTYRNYCVYKSSAFSYSYEDVSKSCHFHLIIQFSKDGISATKSILGSGKISMHAARNLTGLAENSTFIGDGNVNVTATGIWYYRLLANQSYTRKEIYSYSSLSLV